MSAIRILISDDETLIRGMLATQISLESDLEVVGLAENGREAVDLARELRPDVILMDLDMPVLNGIQATEQILAHSPHSKVIVLSGLSRLVAVSKMAGAFACLDKCCTPRELLSTVRQVHAARVQASAGRQSRAADHSATLERLANRARLATRERMVLERVMATELTMAQIARSLSTELKESVTESAVRHALERVMTKLQIEPRTRAALVRHVLEFEQSEADPLCLR